MDSIKIALELPLEVFFDFQKREPATWFSPEVPAQIEIGSIEIIGVEVDPALFKILVGIYEDEILERCWEEIERSL